MNNNVQVKRFVFAGYDAYLKKTVSEMKRLIRSKNAFPEDEIAAMRHSPVTAMKLLMNRYQLYRYPGERVVSPRIFRAQGGGDCDNWAVYLTALAKKVGKPWGLGLKWRRVNGKKLFYHAFAVVDGKKLDPWNRKDRNVYNAEPGRA